MILDSLQPDFGLTHLSEAELQHLNRVWHRLDAWPDSVAGLTRLKRKYTITTLSNGNIGLLTNMAKSAGLPWDCVLSAEVFRAYKPDPATYLGVAKVSTWALSKSCWWPRTMRTWQVPEPAAFAPPIFSGPWNSVRINPKMSRPKKAMTCMQRT
jgi:hypothetical protein